MSREWLTLLIRRMDAVASVYRLAASMSPGIDGLRSRVEFHRRGRFDATITLHDGRELRRGAPGPRPAAPLSPRPAEGLGSVRLQPTPRRRAHPGPQRVGAEADGEVLRASLSQGLLHRRGVQVGAGTTGPPRLAGDHGVVRAHVPHAGARDLPGHAGQKTKTSHHVAGAQAGFYTPTLSAWPRLRRPSASAHLRSGRWTSSPTTR